MLVEIIIGIIIKGVTLNNLMTYVKNVTHVVSVAPHIFSLVFV